MRRAIEIESHAIALLMNKRAVCESNTPDLRIPVIRPLSESRVISVRASIPWTISQTYTSTQNISNNANPRVHSPHTTYRSHVSGTFLLVLLGPIGRARVDHGKRVIVEAGAYRSNPASNELGHDEAVSNILLMQHYTVIPERCNKLRVAYKSPAVFICR